MFSIIDGKGFGITFSNNATVSVQWGTYNYCDRRGEIEEGDSKTAEVAVIIENKLIWLSGDQVEGYVSADTVAKLISVVQQWPKGVTIEKAEELIASFNFYPEDSK